MSKIIIIPDVHGRTFWKEAVEQSCDKIIFLGDYLDPYGWEGISEEDAIANFEDILKFAENRKDCKLLLGNHDCGYIWSDVCSSRRSRVYATDISHMFNENFDQFDLAYQVIQNDKKFLFSHAGIHKRWIDLIIDDLEINAPDINIADLLNNWLHCDEYNKNYFLGMYSNFRGWLGGDFGSCIWADVREWSSELDNRNENEKLGYYQIFGHTQLEEEPIIQDTFACIDVRRYFILEDCKLIDSKMG